jgi:hypothetical protein
VYDERLADRIREAVGAEPLLTEQRMFGSSHTHKEWTGRAGSVPCRCGLITAPPRVDLARELGRCRTLRRVSTLDLALRAGTTQRHIS